MKIKIEIKNRWTGKVLFEFETENNTVKETLLEGIKRGAYLQGADLQGAYLRGADLQGADRQGVKIKTAAAFTGLYLYYIIAYITESDEHRVKMGCHDRSVTEWDSDFWNNNKEFPNDGSFKSNQRLRAYNFAKQWLVMAAENIKTTTHDQP